jgi:hypothetical protein
MRVLPRTLAAIVVAIATMATAHAVEAPAPPACANCPTGAPPDDPAVQANMPGCAAWTDRCVTCERTEGKIACSNIGIACQPQALQCLRPEVPEEKKSGN